MRWSDHRPFALAAFCGAALLAVGEIAVLWLAIHPQVPDHYRAFYITQTTTCLPQPVTAEYVLGTTLDFRSGGDNTRELRPCGWDGPAGDGMHSIGTASRLRFAVAQAQELTLDLELTGVTLPGPAEQRILVYGGDVDLGELRIAPGETRRFTLPVPAEAIRDGYVDILLDFPDAINPGRIANTYWRSVKLTQARLAPAV